jgi:hypothetical protein
MLTVTELIHLSDSILDLFCSLHVGGESRQAAGHLPGVMAGVQYGPQRLSSPQYECKATLSYFCVCIHDICTVDLDDL